VKLILRNIKTSDLYEHIEDNKFVNLRTLKSGEVTEELAAKVFRINVEATELIHKNPAIKNLINKLQLKLLKHD
jgi:hypothetical protein